MMKEGGAQNSGARNRSIPIGLCSVHGMASSGAPALGPHCCVGLSATPPVQAQGARGGRQAPGAEPRLAVRPAQRAGGAGACVTCPCGLPSPWEWSADLLQLCRSCPYTGLALDLIQ